MNSLNPESPLRSDTPVTPKVRQEVRCAVRFPLSLPVVLSAGNNEIAGITRNISASGVLFALKQDRTALPEPSHLVVHPIQGTEEGGLA